MPRLIRTAARWVILVAPGCHANAMADLAGE